MDNYRLNAIKLLVWLCFLFRNKFSTLIQVLLRQHKHFELHIHLKMYDINFKKINNYKNSLKNFLFSIKNLLKV